MSKDGALGAWGLVGAWWAAEPGLGIAAWRRLGETERWAEGMGSVPECHQGRLGGVTARL